MYRSQIGNGATPICYYAVIKHESRGCKISECDKYKQGKVKVAQTLGGFYFEDNNDDLL